MNSADVADAREHFVTLFDNNFLPMGLALHQSLAAQGRPFRLWILCMDDLVERHLRKLDLAHVSLIPLREAEDARLLAVKPGRSRGEYCWTLTPFTPQFVFERDASVRRVTYLDADLYFFAPYDAFFEEFERSGRDVLITDHSYAPKYRKRARRSGRFCVQFITFLRSEGAAKVMRWWQDRCLEWCFARVEDGKYGDQKYLDNWPVLFEREVHVLQQGNRTLAPWNVAYYQQAAGGDARPVFYHFHGLRIVSPSRLLLYSGYDLGADGMVFYEAYLRGLRASIALLEDHDVAVPLLPLSRDLLSLLLRWKRRIRDGEAYATLPEPSRIRA